MTRWTRPTSRNSSRTSTNATNAVIASRSPMSPSRSVGGSSERRELAAIMARGAAEPGSASRPGASDQGVHGLAIEALYDRREQPDRALEVAAIDDAHV